MSLGLGTQDSFEYNAYITDCSSVRYKAHLMQRAVFMAKILGYLRKYTRWDGKPGLSFEKQKQWVERIAQRLEEVDREYYDGRSFHREAADGPSKGWPVLKKLIEQVRGDAGVDNILVIPTLERVRFNPSFLELLLAHDDAHICLYSGWRRCQSTDIDFSKETIFGF